MKDKWIRYEMRKVIFGRTRCWCPDVLEKALSGYTVRCGQPKGVNTPRRVITGRAVWEKLNLSNIRRTLH
jgi:hypothetical protein